MRSRPFQQVDVFTDRPYLGNPVAVVLDAEGLGDEDLQRFARWTNLSETTFVLPPTDPGADYRVRIFTPDYEMRFAGHPTLGTCHAWLTAGGTPRAAGHVVQQCGIGLVTVRREGHGPEGRLAFAAPPLTRSAPSPMLLAKVAQALGLKASQLLGAQVLDNGTQWLGLLLADEVSVLALAPDHRALKVFGQKVGVARINAAQAAPALIAKSNREARAFGARGAARATAPADGDSAHDPADLEVRAFAAPAGIDEDPVTGSLNAALAQWLIADGHLPSRYVATQGEALGRAGRVHVEQDAGGQVWVGGQTVTCIEGQVRL